MKKVLFIIISGVVMFGCYKILVLQENVEKNNAISRCGSEKNIVEKYNQSGEKYYICKVEK